MTERASARIDRVERVRDIAVDDARRTFDEALRLSKARRQALVALEADLGRTEDHLRALIASGVALDTDLVERARLYARWQRSERAQADLACADADQRLESARRVLVERLRERDVLRRLSGRHRERERLEDTRVEQNRLDELGILRRTMQRPAEAEEQGAVHGR